MSRYHGSGERHSAQKSVGVNLLPLQTNTTDATVKTGKPSSWRLGTDVKQACNEKIEGPHLHTISDNLYIQDSST